ncbi:NAD(P)H-dependent FMN reductase [Carnobacterium alterfunditum]|uniref:NAD(P)H-dependent FMN reductase n=1 Tax=Carnobacterium alterfunditum TaxID=28230 RepID=A0A1N6EP94_9LACT|nr:NAD(P)H-dependent oxidoreductase [Carnobacterium alterfunditum]SIN84824.1 NAD(P)H-dependent FMN reductase [Carnobacterium alterfunditum]
MANKSVFIRMSEALFGKNEQTKKIEEKGNKIMKIGIISGSVREGRNSAAVTEWIHEFAVKRNDEGVEYEMVALADYDLPLLGAKLPENRQATASAAIQAWSEKMASFDGYVFITPEYNHAVGGALKNALDFLKAEVANKTASLVGYGSLGGARAHENMRVILGELSVASVRTTTNFSLITDFENMSIFKPNDYNKVNAQGMFDDLLLWTKALNTIR